MSMQHPHRHNVAIWCKRTSTRKRNVHFDASVNEASDYAFLFAIGRKRKNGFYTHSLRLTQHPIDTMLQFDADANAHA